MSNSWIRSNQRDEDRSKLGVLVGELNGEGGKNEVEVAAVRVVSRTEEGGTKLSSCEHPLRNRLCDGTLPCPSQPVQPVDGRLAKIPCPEFDFVQDGYASSLQTTPTVAMPIFGGLSAAEIIEGDRLSC